MESTVKIGIIGDYDGRPSHLATEEALKHSARKFNITMEYEWLPTATFDDSQQALEKFNGLWCSPGSPYKSMNGAINAIRFARENNYPFLGTCGGFQHAVIEYGRNVLQIDTLKDIHYNPYENTDYITALSCSLIGETRRITIDKTSKLYGIYGSSEIIEKYNCSFGLNKDFEYLLHKNGFRVVGTDENREARLMTIENNTFFVASLFQPQLSSTYENPHPLINEYLDSARNFNNSRN